MTAQETKTVQQIATKQAVMESNQGYMANDLQEMKNDIKEIKALILQASELYVSKKVVKYLVGLSISVMFLLVQLYDHLFKR